MRRMGLLLIIGTIVLVYGMYRLYKIGEWMEGAGPY